MEILLRIWQSTHQVVIIDLGWHQRKFLTWRSFAHTAALLDETRVLGSVYIDPTRMRGCDEEVYLWAREIKCRWVSINSYR